MSPHPKRAFPGTSLVVQWLRPCVPSAGGPGWIPGQGTRSYMPQLKVPRAITKTRYSQTKQQNRLEAFLNLLLPTSVNSIIAVPNATGSSLNFFPHFPHTLCEQRVRMLALPSKYTPNPQSDHHHHASPRPHHFPPGFMQQPPTQPLCFSPLTTQQPEDT